jgi:hypothetical protein
LDGVGIHLIRDLDRLSMGGAPISPPS